jgi:hypothetical protein
MKNAKVSGLLLLTRHKKVQDRSATGAQSITLQYIIPACKINYDDEQITEHRLTAQTQRSSLGVCH